MYWVRRELRGKTIYASANEAGELQPGRDKRVEILYKLAPGAKVYRANSANLAKIDGDDEVLPAEVDTAAPQSKQDKVGPVPDDAIIIWTDGACTGNPGPMGIGAVVIDGDAREEISEYLGRGTNNIAELTAILRALEHIAVSERARAVVVHSDSSYSIGLLSKGWKAKANRELVSDIRAVTATFKDLRFVKVKGHAGIPENERCDELATSAISNR